MYLHLDDALDAEALGLQTLDALEWGPRLRCFAPRQTMEAFIRDVLPALPPFVLYGSGDFHHLAAAFLRRVHSEAVNVVSFDNHPDWDVRPPHWACGGWVKRALELPHVRRVSVWGCGNFELNWPARLFRDRDERLDVHAWRERYPTLTKFDCMTRGDWRPRFEAFAESLRGRDVYVTVDLDCLRREEMVTNWENGLFAAEDVAWAIEALRSQANVIGGDVCGAYSTPRYERRRQRFAAEWDHPKLPPRDSAEVRAINHSAVGTIWRALVNSTPPAPLPR